MHKYSNKCFQGNTWEKLSLFSLESLNLLSLPFSSYILTSFLFCRIHISFSIVDIVYEGSLICGFIHTSIFRGSLFLPNTIKINFLNKFIHYLIESFLLILVLHHIKLLL